MSTKEVAEYLRVKERKVYELVRDGGIPCTRVTGKYLFPRDLIDLWLAKSTDYPGGLPAAVSSAAAPRVVAGSHDPLLEWALRESRCGFALMPGGSLDGFKRLCAGEAQVCGLHVLDETGDAYNVPLLKSVPAGLEIVGIEWAWRQQGLVVASGNPHGLRHVEDLAKRRVKVVERQPESGSQILLGHLLRQNRLSPDALSRLEKPALSESDLALAIAEGKADAGIAIEAVARQHRLDFVPLARERYDLVLRRREYFEPPFQTLLDFARSAPFRTRAAEMGGYDVAGLGAVIYNSP
ncbi:MAG: helix-turn-helix transcriptional regulator [Alphaproteobacteria bacterium]|nr:helix-turn-helix transcriptional regulator [Alphaproteobacteria bacterium]